MIFFICPLLFFLFMMSVAASISDLVREKPVPTPPFEPTPIPPPPDPVDEQMAVAVPYVVRKACLAQVKQLTEAAGPGWSYRVALTVLDSQLAVVRNEFDRLLVGPSSAAVPVVLEWKQYRDYMNARFSEMRVRLARLSEQFRTELTPACDGQMPEQIMSAVNGIVQTCQWIYSWGLDQQRYPDPFRSDPGRPVGPRVAEHVFRQVETLVADLRRALTDPQFAGPLLFRAEFYYPKDEEVDRPVIAVLGAPDRSPPPP